MTKIWNAGDAVAEFGLNMSLGMSRAVVRT